jgi:hypothetical protein
MMQGLGTVGGEPVAVVDPGGGEGTFESEATIVDDEQPMAFLEGEDPGGGQQLVSGPIGQPERWTDQRYIYGPDYIDEFVCQVDQYDRVLYFLQDANYTVLGITDEDGEPYWQVSYEPYGVTGEGDFLGGGYQYPRIGMHGLFYERYGTSYTELPGLTTNRGLYYVRNRFYRPQLGRFMQLGDDRVRTMSLALHRESPCPSGQ